MSAIFEILLLLSSTQTVETGVQTSIALGSRLAQA